jgi:hypothetical protein
LNKKLTILLVAALFFAAFSTMPALTVKAENSEVSILSYSWYFSNSESTISLFMGDVIIVGEIQNVGSHIIDYAVVEGTALNATGIVAVRDVRVIVNNILPGAKSPFYIDISPLNSEPPISDESPENWLPTVDHVAVSVATATYTTQTQYADLSISNEAHGIDGSGIFTVSGNVINTGSQTASQVKVLATFYNSSGGVVAVNDYVSTLGSLAPGASTHFAVIPLDNTAASTSQITTYSLKIQSSVGSTSPTATPTQQPTSVPTSSPSASSTPTASNPTSTPAPIALTEILLIVGILVAVAVLVAVALMIVKVRRKNTTTMPNPSSPT